MKPLELEEIDNEGTYYTLSTCQGCHQTLAVSKPSKGADIRKNYLRISIIAIIYTVPCINGCACGFKLRFNPFNITQHAAMQPYAV